MRESPRPRPRKPGAAAFVGVVHNVPAKDLKLRLAERERREALDDRTEAQRWLGDPPADRSALANRIKDFS
jgi:hypothetical protein